MEVQVQNIRHHLFFYSFLAGPGEGATAHENAWEYITAAVEQLPAGRLIHVGQAQTEGR